MDEQKTKLTEQKRTDSATWRLGMACCAAQGVMSVLVAAGVLSSDVCAAATAAFAALLAYCNGNNPSLKDVY